MNLFSRGLATLVFLVLSASLSAQKPAIGSKYQVHKKVYERATFLRQSEYLPDGATFTIWETVLYGSSGTISMIRSEDGNPTAKEVKVKNDQQMGRGEVIRTFVYNNDVYVAYTLFNRDDEAFELWLAKVDPKHLEIVSEDKLMAVPSYSKSPKEIGYYSLATSDDCSHVVVFGVSGSKEGKQSMAYLSRYSIADGSGWTSDIRFDQSYTVIPSRSEMTSLSDNGAAISFRVVFPSEKRRIFKTIEYAAPHEYMVMVFDGTGKQSFSQMLELDERFVSEVSMIEATPGKLTVAGWLSNGASIGLGDTYISSGAFSTLISLSDYSITPYSVQEFTKDLMGKSRNTPLSKINNAEGYIGLHTFGDLAATDGSAYIVAEERYGWTQNEGYYYRGEDALVAKITPDGNIEWVSKLATRDAAQGNKSAFMHKDELHVVFEDHPSNANILDGGYANLERKGNVLAIGSFSKDGKPSKTQLAETRKGDFLGYFDGECIQLFYEKGLHYTERILLP